MTTADVTKEEKEADVMKLTDEAVGEELVDRGEGQACDGSSGVFRSHNFKERPQEKVGFHF